jgi:hypothetical protein
MVFRRFPARKTVNEVPIPGARQLRLFAEHGARIVTVSADRA